MLRRSGARAVAAKFWSSSRWRAATMASTPSRPFFRSALRQTAPDDWCQGGRGPSKLTKVWRCIPGLGALGETLRKGPTRCCDGRGLSQPQPLAFSEHGHLAERRPDFGRARARSGWLARYFDEDGHFSGRPARRNRLGRQFAPRAVEPKQPGLGGWQRQGFRVRGRAATRGSSSWPRSKTLYDQSGMEGGTVAAGASDFIRNIGDGIYGSSDALKAALKSYDQKAGKRRRLSQQQRAGQRAAKPSPNSSPGGPGHAGLLPPRWAVSIPTPISRGSTPICSTNWPKRVAAF